MLKSAFSFFLFGLLASFIGLAGSVARADNATGDKVDNAASESKTTTKKNLRSLKKSARNATGNENKVEDSKASVKNAEDDLKNEENKAKNQTD